MARAPTCANFPSCTYFISTAMFQTAQRIVFTKHDTEDALCVQRVYVGVILILWVWAHIWWKSFVYTINKISNDLTMEQVDVFKHAFQRGDFDSSSAGPVNKRDPDLVVTVLTNISSVGVVYTTESDLLSSKYLRLPRFCSLVWAIWCYIDQPRDFTKWRNTIFWIFFISYFFRFDR